MVLFKKGALKNFANFIGKRMCRNLFSNLFSYRKRLRHSCFPMNFAKCLRIPFLRTTSGRLLLSTTIIRLEYLKLNLRKMRATIFWSLTTTFKWPPLICDRIVTPQFIKQHQHVRIKPSHINSYHGDIIPNRLSNHKAKIIIFFIIDHEELQKTCLKLTI